MQTASFKRTLALESALAWWMVIVVVDGDRRRDRGDRQRDRAYHEVIVRRTTTYVDPYVR